MWKIQKGYNTVSRTFRLPEDLVEMMEVLATRNKISLNNLVIQCLRYAVDHLDTDERLERR